MLARHGLGPEHESWMMMSGLIALCILLAEGDAPHRPIYEEDAVG